MRRLGINRIKELILNRGHAIMKPEKSSEKGDMGMNASVMKPKLPFVTKSELKRTPASVDNRKMVEFMDTHNFSFSISKDSKELRSMVKPKK